MPERCPRCGSTHDSLDGVANHAWKSQDDAHDDITSKDEGMRVAVEEEYSPDDQPADDPPENGDGNLPDGGGDADSSANSGDPTVSGGPPDVPDDPDPTVVDTLSCGCEITDEDTADMTDGTTYRCKAHGNRFTYHD